MFMGRYRFIDFFKVVYYKIQSVLKKDKLLDKYY